MIPAAAIAALLLGLPAAVLVYHAHRSGLTIRQVLERTFAGHAVQSSQAERGSDVGFFERRPIGNRGEGHPRISHIDAVDLDRDGLLDVIVADATADAVSWIRQHPKGTFSETVLAGGMVAPAHVQAVDFDGDGDLDVLVAVLGMLFPNNDRIGSVVVLENDGAMVFRKHMVVERVARVSDVRAGDLDGDGDLDLAVAQFGYDDGETRWIENKGGWQFESHMLQTLSGPIHCEVVDMDGDGDLDLVSLVSQEWEEIYLFENEGRARFTPRLIYGSSNDDFGSSGIAIADLDRDGDADVLYTNGDAFDYIPPRPRHWHGVQWLENTGGAKQFEYHRVADFAGAYSARAADADGDGDLDLFAVSAFNAWENPASKSLIMLENLGQQRFLRRDIASDPTHLLTLSVGDFDGDGRPDLVTGGMHAYPPYDREGRVTLWTNRHSR